MKKITQRDLVLGFFQDHPNRDIPTPEVVDYVTAKYIELTGKPFRDPDRMIRTLFQEGILQKIGTGRYRYDPNCSRSSAPDETFSQSQKDEILRLGEYRCAICGATEKECVHLHVDHIVPRSRGGKATIENGQVLCSHHNNLKKNYGQTETCKRMYKVLHKQAEHLNDSRMLSFLSDIMDVYDKYDINSHIDWRPDNKKHTKLTNTQKRPHHSREDTE